jgi:hypothetical protein
VKTVPPSHLPCRVVACRSGMHFFILLSIVLCAAFAPSLQVHAQTVTTGKSFINLTRPNGGNFLPGDIIEVRATIAVSGGSSTNRVNSVRYNDTINLAKFDYVPNTLRLISNEGRLQTQYTDGADADGAHVNTTNGQLRFNIGDMAGSCNVNTQGTSTTNAGRLWGALRPSFYGSTCISVYSYQLMVRTDAPSVAIDSLIRLNAGNFRYRIGSSSTDQLSNFRAYMIRIAPDYGLCSNSIGSNALLGEFGGTFGSGTAQNRNATAFIPAPYTFLNFGTGTPNDNGYGVANRTSADGSTVSNLPYPNNSRVFTLWDIIGDHTGAADPLAGNPPTSTGYAVIINASYETNRAFQQTITNLCEETYYEFSAWFRNICRRCGCDSSGKGSGSAGYVPGPGNDSSGVRPNLAFQIDDEEYYTSGNIAYTGQWIKKGFVFRTKPGQTSITVTIRNNAPGGGGNDWAIDDIAIATCLPSMTYAPSTAPNVCRGSSLRIYDTVRSYFDNYRYYQWQYRPAGGGPWVDVGSLIGPVTPTWNGSTWEYVATYTVPPSMTALANNGDRYRLITATSTSNIGETNCRSTDEINIVTMNVLDCGIPLSTQLLSFNASNSNGRAQINWTTGSESEPVWFAVEKSNDGQQFRTIATLNSRNSRNELNTYMLPDADDITGRQYYRLRMYNSAGNTTYSRIVTLEPSHTKGLQWVSYINPFQSSIRAEIRTERAGVLQAQLVNNMGQTVLRQTLNVQAGINQLNVTNTQQLPSGVYVLRITDGNEVLQQKLMKQ